MNIDDLDGNLELDSSDSSLTLDDANAQVQPDAQADGAASSTAQSEDANGDLLSVVRDVVDKSRQPEADAASQAEGAETGEPDEGQSKQPDDEGFSDVPFSKHPRFQQLIRQRNEFRQDAQRYQTVQRFMDEQGLTAEETAQGLLIMGLAKTQPSEAWKLLRPFVENVLVAAGELLPPEIQARVDRGELPMNAALELSRATAGQKALEGRRSFEEQQRQRQAAVQQRASVQQAAVDWESDRQVKDPNFAAKLEPLRREIAYLQHVEGIPPTPEGVRDQLSRAYSAVNASLAPKAPPPPPRRPVRPVPQGSPAANARPEPKSTLDIIRQVRA